MSMRDEDIKSSVALSLRNDRETDIDNVFNLT